MHFLLHIIQVAVIPIGNDRLALLLELRQIVGHFAAEECRLILQCRLVNDYSRAFDLKPLHHALNAVLQYLALPKELGTENGVVAVVFLTNYGRKAHGHRGLNNHHHIWIDLNDQLAHRIHGAGIEVVLPAVAIRRYGNNHKSPRLYRPFCYPAPP